MSDTTTLNPGTGGDVIATDDLTTLNGTAVPTPQKALRSKIGYGSDGDFRDVDGTHGLPVQPLAGESHLGAVGGNSIVAGASFNRPTDAIAYSIGDLIANNTAAGSVIPISFNVARVNAGTCVIRRLRLSTTNTGLAGTEVVRVELFKLAPTPVNGDNAAYSVNGIAAISLGHFDVTMDHLFTDGAKGFCAVDVVFDANTGSQAIYALLQARTAIASSSGATWTLAAEALQD